MRAPFSAFVLALVLCGACVKKPAAKAPAPPPAAPGATPAPPAPEVQPMLRKGDPCEGGEKPH